MSNKLLVIFFILFITVDVGLVFVLTRHPSSTSQPNSTSGPAVQTPSRLHPNNVVTVQGESVRLYSNLGTLPLATSDPKSLIADLDKINFFGKHTTVTLVSSEGKKVPAQNVLLTTLVVYLMPQSSANITHTDEYSDGTLTMTVFVPAKTQAEAVPQLYYDISKEILDGSFDVITPTFAGGKTAYIELANNKAYLTLRKR